MQEPGGEAYDDVVREFGPGILNPTAPSTGADWRPSVFRDPERLQQLNALVHPAVHARRRKLEEDFARDHPDGIAVTEAAILIETGSYRDYDRLIVAVCRPGAAGGARHGARTILHARRCSTGCGGRCHWKRR